MQAACIPASFLDIQSAKLYYSRQSMNTERKPGYLSDMPEIRVKYSGLIQLHTVRDYPDGNLYIAEAGRHVPFDIKRAYFINNLFNHKAVRGEHAHKTLKQAIICINGSFTLHLDDGKRKQNVVVDTPATGIFLGEMLWHTMTNFSPDCVILVLASDYYKEEDYIRNYQEFLELAGIADTADTNADTPGMDL